MTADPWLIFSFVSGPGLQPMIVLPLGWVFSIQLTQSGNFFTDRLAQRHESMVILGPISLIVDIIQHRDVLLCLVLCLLFLP